MIHGWIGAPLIVRDHAVGVLNVDSHQVGTYDTDEAEVVTAFADQAAAAVSNAQLFAETQAARLRFASLFQDSIDPILITDLRGIIGDANLRAQTFLGYSHEELVGRSVLDLHAPNPDRQVRRAGQPAGGGNARVRRASDGQRRHRPADRDPRQAH